MPDATSRRAALERLVIEAAATRVSPPILVPADPYFNLAGEELRRRLVLTAANDGGDYCLRPDFTLPIAQTYLASGNGPAAFSYLGPLFRQRADGPAEFEQAGLELLAQPDPDAALDQVFQFALDAIEIYGVAQPIIRLGSVAMFEALLAKADMPEVWRPRLRDRFGHKSIGALLQRLSDPHGANGDEPEPDRAQLVERITGQMMDAGLPLSGGRTAGEIADRFIEKRALAAAFVPPQTITRLQNYLEIAATPSDASDQARAVAGKNIALEAAISSLLFHARLLAERAPRAQVIFDAGFAPRLDYYTGLVFEIAGRTGEVLASGGQYDRLLQRLGSKKPIPASGCAVWVDRLEREAGR